MEKSLKLQQLDSSLRNYLEEKNAKFKCNIPSVFMHRQ